MAAGMGIGRFVYTPILPPMAEALGLSNATAGLIASANFLGYLVGALAAGLPGLPGSRRTWLLGALAVSVLTTAAMAATTAFPVFVVLRFGGGVASAFVLVFAYTILFDRLGRAGRGHLASLLFAGVGAGIFGSAVLVSGLTAAGADWRALWLGSGAASLIALVAVAALVPAADEPAAAAASSAAADASPGRTSGRLVLSYGLFGFGYVITATFLVAIVRETPQIRPIEPWIWIVVGLAAAPSVAIWNRIAARIGTLSAFAAASLVEAVGVAASVLWPTRAGVLAAAFLLGFTFVGVTALGLAAARQRAGAAARQAVAFMSASFGVGQIVGPSFAGFLHERSGSFLLPSLAAAAALVAAAILAATVRD